MESEKVKEIKKGLECCSTLMDNNATSEEQDNSCNECPYRLNDRCSWNLDKDALTLINELESENERLSSRYRNLEINYNDTYEYYREYEVENQQLKDRIAELENIIKNNLQYTKGYGDGVKATVEVAYPKKLNEFAERLKEKCEFNRKEYCCEATVGANDIDETLKEFINE